MMLYDKIKADKQSAFINKNKPQYLLLGTLIGELENSKILKSDVISDDTVIKLIKKYIENNISCNLQDDNQYIECYLPKQLSEVELSGIIKQIMASNQLTPEIKNMGKIMQSLKNNYSGQYDGKLVSDIFKTLI